MRFLKENINDFCFEDYLMRYLIYWFWDINYISLLRKI